MGLRINQNIAAQNAYRNLTVTEGQMSKSLEKLSSGFRINRAADDAAGLVISEGLRAQVGGTKVAIRNAQDGISVVQTAEGALSEVHSILQRMRDLAVQAGNTGSQDTNAVAAAQKEVDGLVSELDRISKTTSFGQTKLLDGSFGVTPATITGFDSNDAYTVTAADTFTVNVTGGGAAVTVNLSAGNYSGAQMAEHLESAIKTALTGGDPAQKAAADKISVKSERVGAGAAITIEAGLAATETFTIGDGTGTPAAELGLVGTATASGTGGKFQVGANTNAADQINVAIAKTDAVALGVGSIVLGNGGATASINKIDAAITSVSSLRADLGAVQNRFEHTIANLSVAAENLSASESRIRDTDMAQEMVQFTRAQILTQAGTAMLAQANQAPQQVLQLLR